MWYLPDISTNIHTIFQVAIALLALVALAAARPDGVLDLDLDDMHHDQDFHDDDTVSGSYR